jgi:hypothetical protein
LIVSPARISHALQTDAREGWIGMSGVGKRYHADQAFSAVDHWHTTDLLVAHVMSDV